VTEPPSFDPAIAAAILAWYDELGRSLPFRGTPDPYAILVSETMAQQTQVARVGAAWTAFLARFPDFAALAAATPADALRAWRGLGYNRRALNLWRAARVVVADHGGKLPRDVVALEGLPGIGPYTARAVAAIAFGQPVGAVDTNVRRSLGRIVAGDANGLAPSRLQALADTAVPRDRPADWTHALMDLGATICRPRDPRCDACPARPWCRYAALGGTERPSLERPRSGRVRAGPGRAPAPRFPSTTRWLRGRLLDRLRVTADGEWVDLDGPIGEHAAAAVRAALRTMAREGLVELAAASATRARLPCSDSAVPGRVPDGTIDP
jgi:A/G-specific adenine glycosylase